MKISVLSLMALLTLGHAQAKSELTDILFNRTATYEDRQSVSQSLAKLGKAQPLLVNDAIAELCYGIDLCAGETPDSSYPSYCVDDLKEAKSNGLSLGNDCYSKYFKQQYECNSDIPKQSAKTVLLAGKLLSDLGTMYNSYIQDYYIDGFSHQFNVNLREIMDDPSAMEEFFRINPAAKATIEVVTNESIALASYTLDCYGSLNPLLFSKNQKYINRYYNLYKAVINTMDLFPKFKGKVNRGVNLPDSVLKEHHKVGNVVCYNGFTSTAIHDPKTDMGSNPRNGFLSGACTQRMYINYDSSAVAGKSISKGSTSKGENEILFEPGACFRIDKVYPRTDSPAEEEEGEACGEGEHYNFEMTLVR